MKCEKWDFKSKYSDSGEDSVGLFSFCFGARYLSEKAK